MKRKCHAIAAPFVIARDELKARAAAAEGSAVSSATGGGKVAPKGPISGPAQSVFTRKSVSCITGLTGFVVFMTGGAITSLEDREAVSGATWLSSLGPRIGRFHETAGSLLMFTSGLTGACGLWSD